MKKFIYLLLLSSSATLLAQAPQDRNVLWVHGLGNQASFWNRQYVLAHKNYKIFPFSFTHDTNEGVQKYADIIRADANPIKGSRTIAVGHSLGGLALRQANKDDNSLFGGIIAVGAPLDGARLANAVISGEADIIIRFSVENLRRGPIASKSRHWWQKLWDTVGSVESGITRLVVSEFILEVIKELAGDVNTTIVNRFDPNNPSVRDLAENSNYLRSIRNFQSSQAKIIAWGNEDSPVHARLMASGLTTDKVPNKMILDIYNWLGNRYRVEADGINANPSWWSGCWRRCKRRRRAEKEAWNAGADYLKRGWEIAWNYLTGALYLEEYTTTELMYVCDGGGRGPLEMIPFYRQTGCPFDSDPGFYYDPYSHSSCNPCRWEYRTVTRHRWVNNPSDGFIKASSQKGEVSNWHGGERKIVRLDGVNHMEMGVHEESDRLFRDAFNGRHGPFFETEERRR